MADGDPMNTSPNHTHTTHTHHCHLAPQPLRDQPSAVSIRAHSGLEYVIECMYGIEAHRLKWGDWGVHRSGWTGKLLAEEMKRIGFVDVVVGDGTTHRHPERDLRVTGKRG